MITIIDYGLSRNKKKSSACCLSQTKNERTSARRALTFRRFSSKNLKMADGE